MQSVRPVWLTPVLAATIMAMALVYTPRPQIGLAQAPPAWEFPTNLAVTPLSLKPDEIEWLTRDGAESAKRRHQSQVPGRPTRKPENSNS